MNHIAFRLACLSLFLFILPGLMAQNWPSWRGPDGDGSSADANLPIAWGAENVVWKSAVPGEGFSSPVIWADRIFLTTALPATQERILLCYARKDGKLLWQQPVLTAPLERKHPDNGYASSTPATDGKRVYVTFQGGEDVMVAAFSMEGNLIWKVKAGTFSSPHGFCSSPVLFKDKLILNVGSQSGAYVVALRCSNGSQAYRIENAQNQLAYSTPFIRTMAGKIQMVVAADKRISAYNPEDGALLWRADGPADEYASSPVYDDASGLVIVSSSYPRRVFYAINPSGSGDVTNTHVVWKQVQGAPYTPSPIVVNGYLLSVTTQGVLHCLEAKSGTVLWSRESGAQYASPVSANGLVYNMNDKGEITVIKPGPVFEQVASAALGEKALASPAISEGRFYYRGASHLFCISK
ncbi:MAG: PQQ-binding-like beta-propeller repeat protein [Bacteroidales bacterium]